MSTERKYQFPKLKSVNHLAKLPIIDSGFQYASNIYSKLKNSNFLFRWGLSSMEGTILMIWDKSLVSIQLIEMPLHLVDDLLYKGMNTVEQRVPVITYPPQLIYNMTMDYVSLKFIEPVVKRADSVKSLSINGASKYGEIAVSRLDNALDVADKYVDKYLPDAADNFEIKDNEPGNNKAIQAIEHANRLRQKLKRRLTRRTMAEAKALRQQGVDIMQFLVYMTDLLLHDPKQFLEKLRAIWVHLSDDEPENQVPPANLEQLIAMISREMSRRFVHCSNFVIGKVFLLPRYSAHAFLVSAHHVNYIADFLFKEALLSHIATSKNKEIIQEATVNVQQPVIASTSTTPKPQENEKGSNIKQQSENNKEQNNDENLNKETRLNAETSQLNELPPYKSETVRTDTVLS